MRKFSRILFGYRDDLNLADRWWHRLLSVAFVLGTIAAAGVGIFHFLSQRYDPRQADVILLTNLLEFTKRSPDVQDTIPSFLKAEGELGGLKNGRMAAVNELSLRNGALCAFDLSKNLQGVADFFNRLPPASNDYTPESVAESIRKHNLGLKPGEEPAHCLDPDTVPFHADTIYKYHRRWTAYVREHSKACLLTMAVLLPLVVLLLNLYYRGLVYIICGPRKKTEAHASVS